MRRIPLSDHLWRPGLKVLPLLLIISLAAALGAIALYKYINPAQPGTASLCQHAAETTNPVMAENSCTGTNGWRLDHRLGPDYAIEGFTAPVSANVGEQVKLYVSTTAPTYTFQVYRMGWYQGLGGHLVYSSSLLPGINQPPPTIDPTTRMVSCSNWHNPVTLTIPANWVSGVYVVKLLSSAGYMRYTSFVVRNDASYSAILFQTSVFTYQAYNLWGGYSLYRHLNAPGEETSNDRAYVVSFDRPYDRCEGLGDFCFFEYNLLRWVERAGYDVSYTTDVDTDTRGELLLHHRLVMAGGHDEYWSTAMRDNVTFARDQGVSLAFMGANDVYWHVRLQNSPLGTDREVICYKYGYYGGGGTNDPLALVDPMQATVLWRDRPLNEPENALLGGMYGGGVSTAAPLVLDHGAEAFLSNTALSVGSALPGLIGGEYDRVYHNKETPSSLLVLASSPLKCIATVLCPSNGTDTANATLYAKPGGARVFDAGTFYWSWGLDNDSFDKTPRTYSTPAFQQFTANILTYLLKSSGH
jgi:hypothetical protein